MRLNRAGPGQNGQRPRATHPELVLLPSLAALRGPDGRLLLTKKYLDGAEEFAKSWPGPVTTLLRVTEGESSEMDLTEIHPGTPGSSLELRPTEPAALAERLRNSAAALAHLAPQELTTAQLCRDLGVRLFFTSEYTPRTEGQIVDANTRNPILRLRRKLWIRNAERTRQRILRDYAAGLQCSGTPTHEIYRPLIANTLLFFDNRVRSDQIISDAALASKAAQLRLGQPLRLVFGGRFEAMKGVLDLPRIARALIAGGVPFTLDIVGKGPLEGALRQGIAELNDERIRLHAAMDFQSGWVPFLRDHSDLFLCPHKQGDPSSTYPEVMSCGVPIIGYDNEAWIGVQRESGGGWRVPLGDADQMARQVAALDKNREDIIQIAQRGRSFAAAHCFEATFARRTAHLAESLPAR